jgi:ATP-dependent Clp protease ATP-binding subunit ClpC
MDWLIIALVTGGILALAAWSLRRMRDELPVPPADGSASSAPHSGPEPPETLQGLAQALLPAYEASAHPQDLREHPAFERAATWLADPAVPLEHVVNYCVGANMQLATIAAEALARRSDSEPAVPRIAAHMAHANAWSAFYILRFLAERASQPVVAQVLLRAQDWWPRNPLMPQFLAEFLRARLARGENPNLLDTLRERPPEDLDALHAALGCIEAPIAHPLRDDLRRWQEERIDLALLGAVGRIWSADDDRTVPLTAPLDRLLAAGLEALARTPPASLLVVGDAGAGKTALIHALGRQLMQQGWTVFEASAADVIAGQTYIGELEQRIRQLLLNLDVARRVIWYIPAFHEMLYAARHRYSPIGLLDLVLPAVESGRLCVVGEVQPAALEKLLQQRPRLRFAFERVTLESASPAETLALAARLVEQEFVPAGVTVAPTVQADALELARQHLSASTTPGNVIDLLRQAALRVLAAVRGGRAMTRDDLLATLAQFTGLPRDVLDDREGLDLAALRAFFERRLMGQPEAVNCLIDRIAMLKAGLTDPNRPIGVFLFAGPTGTGKTEVAKTLAEYLFGSAQRMIRLDMSEFQEPQSLARLVGDGSDGTDTEALVNRIRKQPFSVLLLDEFEKANPRVWDMFLQVFDDARLTDARGGLADFRHSIIILTSNLGAAAHQGGSLGFTRGGGEFSEAQVLRVIGDTFRPEFVNRLDRVVVFRPLSRGVMRDILRKELAAVLQRRGFRNREWAVEWEESALEFLLDRGFTRDMGARPLRRAIDQHVLAPLATTIVEHRFPEGDQFLFVRSDGRGIQVEFVDPDAEATLAPPPLAAAEPAGYAQIILAPRGIAAEREFLKAAHASLVGELESAAWQERKAALLREMNHPAFWTSPKRHAVLAEIERRDGIEAGAQTAQSLLRRLSATPARSAAPPAIVANLGRQLYMLEHALREAGQDLSPDVFVAVEPVAGEPESRAATAEWVARVATMYREWARKRQVRCTVLQEAGGADAAAWVMAMSGPGARSVLAAEVGLHVLEAPDQGGGFARRTARVRLAAQPAEPRRAGLRELDQALACLASEATSTAIVRRYRDQPSPLVRDAQAGWRTGRIEEVLAGDFDLMG